MKVFLSWSGQTSKAIATALRDWLPLLGLGVEPWMSDVDVEAGERWSEEIAKELKQTTMGIVCLTPDNLTAPWLLFEAGALSKTLGSSRVIPYLFKLTPSDLKGPLMQFQGVRADESGTRKLLETINNARPGRTKTFSDIQLKKIIETWWPALNKDLKQISPEITNESAYKFYYEVYGLTYENLIIHAKQHEDGSMTVRRQSKLVASSDGIGVVDQYLISDARSGSMNVARLEHLSPDSKKLSRRVQRSSASNLALMIKITPPLMARESIEFAVVEKTPAGAVTRTYREMLAQKKLYQYESFFWDITRPTKRLEMTVLIPASHAPRSAEPAVWLGPSRITSERELKRILDGFKKGSFRSSYTELSLEVMYPVPGLRYAITWVPK